MAGTAADNDGEEEEKEEEEEELAELTGTAGVDAAPVSLTSDSGLPLRSVRSTSSEWTDEEMLLDWTEQLTVHRLQLLRDFFLEGMQVNVVEEKVLRTFHS